MQVARGFLPVVLEHEVVPVRNLVVHGAACRTVTERNAAIHAPRGLLLQVAFIERKREFAEVANTFAGQLILLVLPIVFEKARDLAHAPSLIPPPANSAADPFLVAPCGIPPA